MTKPRYSQDCWAAFKVYGQTLSSSPVANNSNNAWIVNFNNGNDNNNNKNNNNYVRLVRSSECLPVVVPPSVCFYNVSYCHSQQNRGHSKLTHCHSERSEESQSNGHTRCFVPQHDKRKIKEDVCTGFT